MLENHSLISRRKSSIFCSSTFFLSSLIGFTFSGYDTLAILSLIVSILFVLSTLKLTTQINKENLNK